MGSLSPLYDFQDLYNNKSHKKITNLSDKYAPETLENFVGNKEIKEALLHWVDNPALYKEKVCIVFGPPGVGKSTLLKLIHQRKGNLCNIVHSVDQENNILEMLDGNISTKRVVDIFSDENGSDKKDTLFLLDDLDKTEKGYLDNVISKLTRNSKVSTHNSRFLTVCDCQMYKKFTKKKNMVKLLLLERVTKSDLHDLITNICNKERKRTPPDFIERVHGQANGDIRASLQNLEILLKTNDTRAIDLSRDQENMIPVSTKILMENKMSIQERCRLAESDTYSISYTLHENFPDRTQDLDIISQISDDICTMDILNSSVQTCLFNMDNSALESMFGVTIPSARLQTAYSPTTKKLRPYKIISSGNQSIISKNKIIAAQHRVSINTTFPFNEMFEAVQVFAKFNCESGFRWFFSRFKKLERD